MCDQRNIMLEMFEFCFKNGSTNTLVPYHILDYDDYVQNSQSHYKQWTFHLLSLGKYTQNFFEAFRLSNQNEQGVHCNPSKGTKQKYPSMVPLGTKLFLKTHFHKYRFFFSFIFIHYMHKYMILNFY